MKHIYKKWFTLVELIVVITILAVLATVAFVSFSWYSLDAKNTTNKANLRTIWWGLQFYHTKNNEYPEVTDGFNITSSWSVYAVQWTMWKKTLGLIWVSQDTVDANTKQPYFYSLSASKQKYGLVSFQNTQNSFLMWVHANDLTKEYKWNGAPIIVNQNNENITSDIDVLTIADTYEVYFDNNSYWEESNKLLKYYYHPNAISIVNFNDDNFDDIVWNLTTTNKKPSITQGKVWNGMLINWDGGGLQVDLNKNLLWQQLTMSAWVKQKSYTTDFTTSSPRQCWENSIIMRFEWAWAYMVSGYQWDLCGYHYWYEPRGYHPSTGTIPLDTWTHVVSVWDGNNLKFYMNWLQVWSSINSSYEETYKQSRNVIGSYLIWIEKMDTTKTTNSLRRYFDWVIDEVGVFNTALSDAEILELYNITK